MLNRARCGFLSFLRLAIHSEIINPSSATIIVPAAGPYRSTAVKTNVSELEMEAKDDGSVTVAEPLIRVKNANRSHCAPIGAR